MIGMILLAAAVAGCLAVLAVGVQVVLFFYGCYRARQIFLSSSIPGPKLTSTLTGHVPDIMGPKGPWSFINWRETYGSLFKLQIADVFVVSLTDPDVIAQVTRKTGPLPYFPKSREIYQVMEISTRPKRQNILSSSDDAYWKAVRQATAPCFSMSNIKQTVPLVLDLTKTVAEHMSRHPSFDITDAAKRITSDVMGHLLYGEDLRGVTWEPSEYLQVLYPVLKAESELFNNPFHLWQLWDAGVRQQRRALVRHNAIIGEKLARMRKQPPAAHTIAAHILSAIDPATGKPIDDGHAKGEIATFMAAGFETTSHAITWTLTMIAAHPEVQDQVYQELQQAGLAPSGATPGRDFTASDLGRLPLLSAVYKEALRLCTPVPFGGSRTVEEAGGLELCGHHLPKGTVVMMPLLAYGFSTELYGPDALLFKPQRWMPTSDGSGAADQGTAGQAVPPDPYTFMTGQRDCIGQNLAKLELQVVLATLLSCFRFSPGPELQQELSLAAATGQPPVKAVHALAGDYITMQPLSGKMVLNITARS